MVRGLQTGTRKPRRSLFVPNKRIAAFGDTNVSTDDVHFTEIFVLCLRGKTVFVPRCLFLLVSTLFVLWSRFIPHLLQMHV